MFYSFHKVTLVADMALKVLQPKPVGDRRSNVCNNVQQLLYMAPRLDVLASPASLKKRVR